MGARKASLIDDVTLYLNYYYKLFFTEAILMRLCRLCPYLPRPKSDEANLKTIFENQSILKVANDFRGANDLLFHQVSLLKPNMSQAYIRITKYVNKNISRLECV